MRGECPQHASWRVIQSADWLPAHTLPVDEDHQVLSVKTLIYGKVRKTCIMLIMHEHSCVSYFRTTVGFTMYKHSK